jgi:hypothetical protein
MRIIAVLCGTKQSDMKKTKQMDVWMVSRVSVFLNESIGSTQGELAVWYMNDGSEVVIDFGNKEIQFVDWVGDDKTYFSIVGVGSMSGFKSDDYFTEK